jgi:O-antigen/teichoic acid export membrane protein
LPDQCRNKIVSSLIWKLLERGGTQGIQFILSIILARLLMPNDYGIIALITIFLALANCFVQSSFNTALIQKKNADETDFSSVFYLSLFIAFVFYFLIFFLAPFIAKFYHVPILVLVLRVLSLTLFFGAINSVQYAKVSKTMQFKRFFYSSIVGVLCSGLVGVFLAYKGYGVWALITQQLVNNLIISIILWFTVKWRPRLLFSIKRLNKLFSYGWKLLFSSLLDTIYTNIYGLVIGKYYDSAMLGLYNRGQQFPGMIVTNINGSIQSVMLPALSERQNEIGTVKNMARRSIKSSSFIVLPLMMGLAVIAKPLVSVLLTDKWISCVPFLQLSCIVYALYPVHTANLTVINAIGRSDIFLKLEIIKKIIVTVMLIVTIRYGIYAMAIGQVITSCIATFINAYPNKKLLNYDYLEQLKDLLPSIVLSFVMGASIYTLKFFSLSDGVLIIMQIVSGIAIYFLFAKLLRFESYEYLVQTFKQIKKY